MTGILLSLELVGIVSALCVVIVGVRYHYLRSSLSHYCRVNKPELFNELFDTEAKMLFDIPKMGFRRIRSNFRLNAYIKDLRDDGDEFIRLKKRQLLRCGVLATWVAGLGALAMIILFLVALHHAGVIVI